MENKCVKNIVRFNPKNNFGLTRDEVKKRIKENLVNVDKTNATKSNREIIFGNLFTLFNFINFILAIAILCVGSYRNLLFMGVVVCNCVIGIAQEIRAKITVERLNLISSNNAKVIRDGKKGKIKIDKLVLDDIIFYESGNQIVADAIVTEGKCEVNESLLTGESDLILKKPGDMLLSGSYVVSGKCTAKVEHVGESNYASTLLKGSKYIKKTKSEIMFTLDKIIKIISVAILPLGAMLFYRQLLASSYDWESAVVNTSAALTGMIPEGLVLLTSTVLAVGVLRLSKYKVLVQDLYCLETLARVDTLCLDKTGTITEGTFEVCDVIEENGFEKSDIKSALNLLTSALNDNNETFKALKKAFSSENSVKATKVVSFSSERKWSGASFKDKGSFIIGAAEFIFGNSSNSVIESVKRYSKGYRVLTLACSDYEFGANDNLPGSLQLMGFILIKDKIRNNAERTLKFFKNQGVNIKVISGDNPVTVSKIAERVKLDNFDKYVDATTLKTDKDIEDAVKRYTVFGRVTPNQKQKLIKCLKKDGHIVSMVGDGVNDVLAMKESDCSVAMASGSEIARNVSHLVLLNSDFSSMPKAVAEGRRAINNIQRSSSLYITKTIYSFLLSLIFMLISVPYPFIPIQMTLISAITIGIPSFILALEPNRERISGNLFKNIIKKSVPAALTVICVLMICVGMYEFFNMSQYRYSLFTVFLTSFVGIMLIYNISLPLNKLRKSIIYFVSVLLLTGITKFRYLLELEPLTFINFSIILFMMLVSYLIYRQFLRINFEKYLKIFFKKSNSK